MASITFSGDWVDYLLNTWLPGFPDPTYGDFNPTHNPGNPAQVYSQWAAGGDDISSVILNGSFTYVFGDLAGTINSLRFGNDLNSGFSLGSTGLVIDLGGASPIASFDQAIYVLTRNGSFTSTGGRDGLFDYFAEVGTVQTGLSGDDTLTSFGGTDILTGGAGYDTFVFQGADGNDQILDFDPNEDYIDVSAWSSYTYYNVTGGVEINGGADGVIFVAGITTTDIDPGVNIT